jgi:hypothetical protein
LTASAGRTTTTATGIGTQELQPVVEELVDAFRYGRTTVVAGAAGGRRCSGGSFSIVNGRVSRQEVLAGVSPKMANSSAFVIAL